MSLTIDLGFHSTEWISMSEEFIRSKFFWDAGWVRLQKKILKNKAGYSWMESGIIEQLQREFGNSIAQKKNLDKETAKNRTKGDPKPLIFQNGNELYALSWEELKKVIEKIQTDGKWDKGTELIHSERKNYFADYQMKTEEDIENFLKREMGGLL